MQKNGRNPAELPERAVRLQAARRRLGHLLHRSLRGRGGGHVGKGDPAHSQPAPSAPTIPLSARQRGLSHHSMPLHVFQFALVSKCAPCF